MRRPALSFLALLFSNSDLIRTFGEAGFIATVIALVTVLSLVPVLGVALVRKEAAFAATIKGADTGVDVLRRFCGWIAARMVRRPGLYSLIGLVVVGGLGVVYVQPRADAIGWPTRCPTRSRPSRRAAASTPS